MKEMLEGDQRLVILRSLNEMLGHSANESIIDSCLDQYGHRISRDRVRNHMQWLAEQGLVDLTDVAGCLVASLSGRGSDVATGQAVVPGVRKPRAGS